MIYKHWKNFKGEWHWPNFSPVELSCKCCGEYYHDEEFLDKLQSVRNKIGKPLVINSAHRCVTHNRNVGGAKASQHLKIAADIQTAGRNKKELLKACQEAGFKGFGFYKTFLHVDLGPKRTWGDKSYYA